MKKFFSTNWYKLMIGSSFLMASFGFMIYSVTTAHAKEQSLNSNFRMIPVNEDGSISVKLSPEQLKAITPPVIQTVNVAQINGNTAGCYSAYRIDGTQYYALAVQEINPW